MDKQARDLKWHVTTPLELYLLHEVLRAYVIRRNHNNLLGSCVCFGSFVAILDLCLYM